MKKNMSKRVISIVLCVVLMMALASTAVAGPVMGTDIVGDRDVRGARICVNDERSGVIPAKFQHHSLQ